jgi:hypothetical protein
MMAEATALKLAVDLLHVPSRARPMRSAALPDDVLTLLEIAAGDPDATSRASELTGRAPDVVRNAAAFFVEQILLAPGSDSYRVLGGNAQTSSGDLRRNMALLLKWLHPDMERNNSDDRSVFAGRVTLAWEDLKTSERRAAYDALQKDRARDASPRRSKAGNKKRTADKHGKSGPNAGVRARAGQPPRFWQALLMLFGSARH